MAIVSKQQKNSLKCTKLYLNDQISDTDTDFSESEGLSSLQISGQTKGANQSADESGKF